MSAKSMPSHHGPGERPSREAPNETIRLLFERSSCRSFQERPIPPEVLDDVLTAGIHAPTGGNLQPYSIIKIEDPDTRGQLGDLVRQRFIATAPVNLLFCIDWRRIERWATLQAAPFTATEAFPHFWISIQDTICCAQNICTAADALGLGSVYIGTVLEFLPELREMFLLPACVLPVVLLSLGYPKKRPLPRKKLGPETVVHAEQYHELNDDALLAAFDAKYKGQKVACTPERLKAIYQVCQRVHGTSFAETCIEKIKEIGYITPVQRYFGLHYRADSMLEGREEYLRAIRESGFDWFSPSPPEIGTAE